MKCLLLLILFSVCFFSAFPQSPTIQVSGSNIIGICNDSIVLRGIDYAPFNWGWDANDEKFSEIAKTGANCVRIVWYSTAKAGGGASVYDDISDLDTAIARCIRNKMIAIIELHDITCNSDLAQLETLSNWYLGAGVKNIINKYAHSLIINIANEAGYVQWSGSSSALADFRSAYESIVNNLRNAGINVPLMIDAPDCGTNLDTLASIAADIESADIRHNIIFSAHAYWYSYANNDSLTMRNIIAKALSKGVPIVFGEMANFQDGSSACQYSLNYQALLSICQQMNIGWIAWGWDEDACSLRQISSDGNYSNLTTYGKDIVNNAIYGLKQHADITSYLANNHVCDIGTTVPELGIRNEELGIKIYPNPANSVIVVHYSLLEKSYVNLRIYDITGNEIETFVNSVEEKGNYKSEFSTKKLNNGIYFLTLQTDKENFVNKVVIQK